MLERLTKYFECGAYTEKRNIIDVSDKVKFFENGCLMGKAIDKLTQLEDIMEKYGIESVEELDKKLADGITWQKACEFLAYEYAEEYFDGRDIEHCFNADKRDKFVKENINYFYQQAKKEGNDDNR